MGHDRLAERSRPRPGVFIFRSGSSCLIPLRNKLTKVALLFSARLKGKFRMAAEIGNRFPDFSLQNQDGKTVKLDDFAGKWLVLYVYPKDDTPGCTIQGKSFTATRQEFDDAGVAVVGVSADDVASHRDFCNKFAF